MTGITKTMMVICILNFSRRRTIFERYVADSSRQSSNKSFPHNILASASKTTKQVLETYTITQYHPSNILAICEMIASGSRNI